MEKRTVKRNVSTSKLLRISHFALFIFCFLNFSLQVVLSSGVGDVGNGGGGGNGGREREAIGLLHKQMDDDLSGTVDLEESSEFVREELKIQEKDKLNRRQESFHVNNDHYITIDDLWGRWLNCTERNWTLEETIEWLNEDVELPQYKESFQKNAVDGRTLPRLAIQNASFLVNVLGITNPVHRQKIQLKAMDVVLFGSRLKRGNYWKDVLLVGFLTVALFLFALNRHQKSIAQKEMTKLVEQKEKLLQVQDHFEQIQSKLEEEREKHEEIQQNAKEDGDRNKEEVIYLKRQLQNAEKRIEQGVITGSVAPLALQPLLRKTCQLELARINQSKRESLAQMKEAMETVDKLKKKQGSVLHSVKLAVASGPAMENFDQRIVDIKQKMESTGKMMEECQNRWTQIESLCGYPILDATFTSTGSGFLRTQLLTQPTLEEIKESVPAATLSNEIQPKVAPQFYCGAPMQRSMLNFGSTSPMEPVGDMVTHKKSRVYTSSDVFSRPSPTPAFTLGDPLKGGSGGPRQIQREREENNNGGGGGYEEDSEPAGLGAIPSSASTGGVSQNTSSSLKPNNSSSSQLSQKESQPARKLPPSLGNIGKTDSQESSSTFGDSSGSERGKKKSKLRQLFGGKKEYDSSKNLNKQQ